MADRQREAARLFAQTWRGKGDEKRDCQKFWLQLLQEVYGVEHPYKIIDFEAPVKVRHIGFIDCYIHGTKVLIEQKSLGIDLGKPAKQSDGATLTPYEQAKRYADNVPYSMKPRYIVTSNFAEFWVYDMEKPLARPEKIRLEDLPQECHRLRFLADSDEELRQKEEDISVKAGELVGQLYDAFAKEYADLSSPESMHSLNVLCVRLVFCLYAEKSGLFGKRDMFHDYLDNFPHKRKNKALAELFDVLDQRPAERSLYVREDQELSAFPYVNGGLFAERGLYIPAFNDEIYRLLLQKAHRFDWSQISPTIFGAVFESTLNPETRRSGGMHYTSVQNIHKVIDPLFMEALWMEFKRLRTIAEEKARNIRLLEFQTKVASLSFLDPACGSGNFLTESYLSLRKLENEILMILSQGQSQLAWQEVNNPIKVSLSQFHGIEINEFAVSVAKTALWIAESQMMAETERIVRMQLDFLPLKTSANIVEGNALRLDWESVVPRSELSYIMGNPPFVGNARLSDEQKEDRNLVFPSGNCGELDYVACWYKKAADYIEDKPIKCAFVSTNSICQGQQVAPLWKPLMETGIVINFAHQTFVWDSEASLKAHVYCVVVGFSRSREGKRTLYTGDTYKEVENINGYLVDAPNVFVNKCSRPLCDVPIVIKGFQPTDDGNLILDDAERDALLKAEPVAERWIRPFITAKEYIHGKNRWCLWLVGISPAELNAMPIVKERVTKCKIWRESQIKTGDAYKLRYTPTLMRPSGRFKESAFIILPRITSEGRKYIPFGFAKCGAIPGDSLCVAIDATLYHFGVLMSNVHNGWMRAVCGRLKGDYRYSSDIVYNNFPWPSPTEEQRERIEETARAILAARALYPDSSLADLYDETIMPPELRTAHQRNDRAVCAAYGWGKDSPEFQSEAARVSTLMRMYQRLAGG